MAQANWQSDQPTNLNYLSPINFDFQSAVFQVDKKSVGFPCVGY